MSLLFLELLSQIQHVDVDTQAHVVGQIIAFVVWIVVDDDVIAIPVPTAAVAYIESCHAPKEAVKAEAVGSAAVQMPNVAAADAAGEMAVLPRVIEMVVRVVFTGIVPDPLPIVMHVGRFWVARSIGAMLLLWRGSGILMRSWAMRRFESATHPFAAASTPVLAAAVLIMLRAQKRCGCHG